MTTPNYIAIDIAKDSLQVHSQQRHFNITYDNEGLSQLLEFVKKDKDAVVVCEATGSYERKLIKLLLHHDQAVALLNPARVRAFACSKGIRAKTDSIDAKLILDFAQQNQPRLCSKGQPQHDQLVALMDRRSQLNDMLVKEKNRLDKSSQPAKSSIEKVIAFLQKQLEDIEQEISQLIESNEQIKQQDQIMQSVKGVGKTTSWSILAYLQEINDIGRNQLVALAGLAPFNRDSGQFKGRRFIQAGRAKLRKSLYMAATTAAVHNPVIKSYVQGLRQRGKPYKMAIVAAMRKLLIHIQSLLKYS